MLRAPAIFSESPAALTVPSVSVMASVAANLSLLAISPEKDSERAAASAEVGAPVCAEVMVMPAVSPCALSVS